MQIGIKNNNLKGISKLSQATLQGNSANELPKWHKEAQVNANKDKLFFNLTVQPILSFPLAESIGENELRNLARLMVKATQELTGDLSHWQFSASDGLPDLILRCASRLQQLADIDKIEVYHEGNLKLGIKRYVGSRKHIYCLYILPVYKLKKRNRRLANIIVSFLKSLGYSSIFDDDGYIEWIWEILLDELQYYQEDDSDKEYYESLMGSISFLRKFRYSFENAKSSDWLTELKVYNPKKREYRAIKNLLMSSLDINFHSPYQLTTYSDEIDFAPSDTFFIGDHEDSPFLSQYIEMMNQMSNEYDIVNEYAFGFIDMDQTLMFNERVEQEVTEVEDFICEFNELLKKI